MARQMREEAPREEIRADMREELDDIYALGGSILPDLPPDDAYHWAWLRVLDQGKDDEVNMAAKQSAGWEFVKPGQLPDNIRARFPSRNYGKLTGVVGINDVALARLPIEVYRRRRELIDRRRVEQAGSVDRYWASNPTPRTAVVHNESKSREQIGSPKFG